MPAAAAALSASARARVRVGINLRRVRSRSLYAVDRLARFAVDERDQRHRSRRFRPKHVQLRHVPMANYTTGAPITSFSNPVAIGEDDYVPGAGVLDSVSGTPYLTLVELEPVRIRRHPGDGGIINAHAGCLHTGWRDTIRLRSPFRRAKASASGMIYILQRRRLDPSRKRQQFHDHLDLPARSGRNDQRPGRYVNIWNETCQGFNGSDYVFRDELELRHSLRNLERGYVADGEPDVVDRGMVAAWYTPTTFAVSADNIDNRGYISFLAFDTGNGGRDRSSRASRQIARLLVRLRFSRIALICAVKGRPRSVTPLPHPQWLGRLPTVQTSRRSTCGIRRDTPGDSAAIPVGRQYRNADHHVVRRRLERRRRRRARPVLLQSGQ